MSEPSFPLLRDGRQAWPDRKAMHHAESYCLMLYASEEGEVEYLWNSRDGVTPFTIDRGLMHVQWHADAFVPFFVPPVGMRIFVDLTLDRALDHARRKINRYWNHDRAPMKDNPRYADMSMDDVVELVAREMVGQKGTPDIIAVDHVCRRLFVRRARALSLLIP